MEMLSAFTGVLHVPNLSQPEHVMSVLEESDAFTKKDLAKIQKDLRGAKYVPTVRFTSTDNNFRVLNLRSL